MKILEKNEQEQIVFVDLPTFVNAIKTKISYHEGDGEDFKLINPSGEVLSYAIAYDIIINYAEYIENSPEIIGSEIHETELQMLKLDY